MAPARGNSFVEEGAVIYLLDILVISVNDQIDHIIDFIMG